MYWGIRVLILKNFRMYTEICSDGAQCWKSIGAAAERRRCGGSLHFGIVIVRLSQYVLNILEDSNVRPHCW